MMDIHAANLRRGRPAGRELGQRVERKKLHAVGFVAESRRTAGDLANEKRLPGVKQIRRMLVLVAVVERGELDGARGETRFLLDLLLDRVGGTIVHVRPT